MTVSWIAVLTAAVSHTVAGGPLPHPLLVLVAGLISGPIGVLLAGRRRSLGSLAAVVTGAQVLFHALFTLFPLHAGEFVTTTSPPESAAARPLAGGHHHEPSTSGTSVSLTPARSPLPRARPSPAPPIPVRHTSIRST